MTIELTNEEKTSIINQHMQNVAYTLYNAQLSLIEANAVSTPNESNVSSINAQIADATSQMSALQSELNALTPTSN
jgi:hypothetical protein